MHRKFVYRILERMETYYRSPENSCPLEEIRVTISGKTCVGDYIFVFLRHRYQTTR